MIGADGPVESGLGALLGPSALPRRPDAALAVLTARRSLALLRVDAELSARSFGRIGLETRTYLEDSAPQKLETKPKCQDTKAKTIMTKATKTKTKPALGGGGGASCAR